MRNQTKKEIREQLKKDIEKFISNGGEVTQVESKKDFRFGHRNQLSNFKKHKHLHVAPGFHVSCITRVYC